MKFSIEKIVDNEDGTKSLVFDYDDEMLAAIKSTLGKDEPTEEEITKFLISILELQVLEEQKQKEEKAE